MEQEKEVLKWIDGYFCNKEKWSNLVGVLLALQDRFGYLPKVGMKEVARKMKLSPANVFAAATFYNQFRLIPPGRHSIKVCMGTACHIKQGGKILEHWERELHIKEGEVTSDHEYSLDRVACVGCCALAPVTVIGDKVIGDMSPTKVDGILLQHKIKREQAQKESEGDANVGC